MNFQDSLTYLLSLGNEVVAMKLGLENITRLLHGLGSPQDRYIKVQVAGTNGKGSVCAFLDSICRSAGIRTGVFTSPHLISITERVRVDGIDISEGVFARFATVVRETSEKLIAEAQIEHTPTFFEQVTAIALLAFADANVELAILETGLGGRLDATTAARAEIAAITRIDCDHQEYLGSTLAQIAAEKAAIIRPDSIVCVGKQHSAALDVISARCTALGVDPDTLEFASWNPNSIYGDFSVGSFRSDEIAISLAGDHQLENAALGILTAQKLRNFYRISDEHIWSGLEQAAHPGRMEWVDLRATRFLLDGAHNPSGSTALAAYLRKGEPDSNIVLVYGSMKDKDVETILQTLSPLSSDVIVTQPANSRSMPAEIIAKADVFASRMESVFVVPDVEDAIDSAITLAETYSSMKPSFVLVAGSLYLVGEVKRILKCQI